MIINESGMTFKTDDTKTFHLENSNLYKKLQEYLKVAEFIAFYDDDNKICEIVEAKSSSPNPNKTNDNNKDAFNSYISEINEKFVNSFNLYLANRLKRHGKHNHEEMPDTFRNTELETLEFKFVFIIKGHKKEWLIPISDKLKIIMKPFIKAWNLKDHNIKVMNDAIAKEMKYIE